MTARRGFAALLALGLVLVLGIGLSPRSLSAQSEVEKTPAVERALRRAYDGAPPVIPHKRFQSPCVSCHNERGMQVPGTGFSPPTPHEFTKGMSLTSRCQQCHVFRQTETEFRTNSFAGLRQDLRQGRRLNPYAPPVMPHLVLMRENCVACHSGTAAREEIRTPHPERDRCRQCHLEQKTVAPFRR